MGVDCRQLPWSLHHCGVFRPEMPSGLGGALVAIPQGRVEQGVLDPLLPPPGRGGYIQRKAASDGPGFPQAQYSLPHTGQVWDSCGPVIRWVCGGMWKV